MPKPSAEGIVSRLGEREHASLVREVASITIAAMDAHYAELVRAAREVFAAVDGDEECRALDRLAAALRGLE